MKSIFFWFLLLMPGSFFAQSLNNNLTKTIASYSECEKIYVHTDRNNYTAGGDVFIKIYLTDEQLSLQNAKSKVAYVDLVSPDQEVLATKIIAIKKGEGEGDFKITSKFKSGHYLLRAYTAYMKNGHPAFFFRKTIYIRGVTNLAETAYQTQAKKLIQFFPEGGDLVVGLRSKIAVKATNELGMGIDIIGEIKTENNQVIQKINTNKLGFGQFSLIPEVGQDYFFEGTFNGKTIKAALPIPLKEGAIISADTKNENKIQLKLATNLPTNLENGLLIGHAMGKVFLNQSLSNEAKTSFEVETATIPFGILHFTLFDQLGQPRSERLVFNFDGIDNFNVDISTNKETYNKREKVQLKLDLYDDEGEALDAALSLTVVDHQLQMVDSYKDNIQSYLLLSSDIRGTIEQPNFYFKKDGIAQREAMDLLLLTQGWRSFTWQEALKNPIKKIEFPYERSLAVSGKITTKEDPSKSVKAVGYLSELSSKLSMTPFETDEQGQFYIDDLYAVNNTEMILQAATLNKKQQKVKKGSFVLKGDRNIAIYISEKTGMKVGNVDIKWLDFSDTRKEKVQNLSILEDIQYDNDLSYVDGDWSITLDSVSVTANRVDKMIEYYEDGMLYKRPDTRIRMAEIIEPNSHNNVLSIIAGRVPGMQWDVSSGAMIIRGKQTGLSGASSNNNARFMVNGVLVPAESVASINPADIAFVDVIRGLSQLAMYGEVGGNGLIMIYLNTPEERKGKKKPVNGIMNFTLKGYNQARTFYAPIYDGSTQENKQPDNRITLHWAPRVEFSGLGEANISFYTADRSGTYDIIIEGLSKEGLPIIANKKIIVK